MQSSLHSRERAQSGSALSSLDTLMTLAGELVLTRNQFLEGLQDLEQERYQ
ncbi:MAG: hypothetical protein AB2L14_33390 [Candidatus Xenobiia bacterium LiM19]